MGVTDPCSLYPSTAGLEGPDPSATAGRWTARTGHGQVCSGLQASAGKPHAAELQEDFRRTQRSFRRTQEDFRRTQEDKSEREPAAAPPTNPCRRHRGSKKIHLPVFFESQTRAENLLGESSALMGNQTDGGRMDGRTGQR